MPVGRPSSRSIASGDDPNFRAGYFGSSPEAIDLLEGLPTGILSFFLGFPAVAKNRSRQIQTPPVMAAKQFSEGFLIAVAGCFNELWIAEYIGRFAQGATSLELFVLLEFRLE